MIKLNKTILTIITILIMITSVFISDGNNINSSIVDYQKVEEQNVSNEFLDNVYMENVKGRNLNG